MNHTYHCRFGEDCAGWDVILQGSVNGRTFILCSRDRACGRISGC